MPDFEAQARVTTSSAKELAEAGESPPFEDRKPAPMAHPTAGRAEVAVQESSGIAAAEAGGTLKVDNGAPAAESAGSG
ncbi:hypothetical protein [Glacieibacterium frigidum]|uniref:Uncharacterized protein n=1 Tax=Glacieibacterium frigidum TaxID=2593303 RepID=A0A552UGF0_9SPHN|nr:hypothetical protein [Glacieibacterium frigidum]TRW17302.1 hypothetical protein FMM06_03750 [Glacieibacterium frigidum]